MAELLPCLHTCDLDGDQFQAHSCVSACLHHQGLEWEVDAPTGLGVTASVLIVGLVLVPLCAMFSGLTLGLLSLDINALRILEDGGEPKEREYAKQIIPVRQKGNLLLCTLLLGNTIVNAATSVIVADVTSGLVGIIISTALIVIFGEIIPQSVCTRHGLQIGAASIPVVRMFTFLLYPIAFPISLCLDYMLGRDIGTVYSQEELKRLIDMHYTDPDAQRESGLTFNDHRLLTGALQYKHKLVRDVMTPLEHCFMLDKSMRLTFQSMLAIYKSGFTRIPVFDGDPQNIVGILYAKDLILLDPDDEIELGSILSLRGRDVGQVRHISDDETLDKVFVKFMTSNNHMLIAHSTAPAGRLHDALPADGINGQPMRQLPAHMQVVGLITLEDVMEEVLQAEITDETDPYEDPNASRRGPRRVELERYLSMFEHKISMSRALSPQEITAVASFLTDSVAEFAGLASSDVALKGLIRFGEVLERTAPRDGEANTALERVLARSVSAGEVAGHAFEELSAEDTQLVLYRKGQPSANFTLILQGRVLIHTGAEDFELELGPWSVLGNKALANATYIPDFDAVALPPCRLLRIPRSAYRAALDTLHPLPLGMLPVNKVVRGSKSGGGIAGASARTPPAVGFGASTLNQHSPAAAAPAEWRASFTNGNVTAASEAAAQPSVFGSPNLQRSQVPAPVLAEDVGDGGIAAVPETDTLPLLGNVSFQPSNDEAV